MVEVMYDLWIRVRSLALRVLEGGRGHNVGELSSLLVMVRILLMSTIDIRFSSFWLIKYQGTTPPLSVSII
jgi:hypothetical protein